eukprot:TRINITY_DN10957_c0_g1_i2.p1 TRINITY_DN10957_c0_g1~~TRINITY_DN10957_c0_g1_i2.p1  ORF type:complete len:328 (+),score=108.79 TRINITY_DN10957_c0_g1_i2:286-1269(+)
MEVGGNGRARAFFRKHGLESLKREDINTKYKSRAAELYREQIKSEGGGVPKRASTFAQRPTSASKPVDDFGFDETDKPKSSSPQTNQAKSDWKPSKLGGASVSTAPKKVEVKKTTLIGDSPVLTGYRPAAAPATKVAAKKVTSNFDDWDDWDEEEEEEEPEKEPEYKHSESPSLSRIGRIGNGDSKKSTVTDLSSKKADDDDDFFNPRSHRAMDAKDKRTKPAVQSSEEYYAREKFSKAKSISSAQYFGDDKNKNDDAEKAQMISRFSGAKAISSSQYFGNGEEDDSRVVYTAQTDLGSLRDVVVEGSKKIGNMASDWFNNLPSLEG